ncbi:kunitz trypsin inhibitor 5-like [Lycium ferocissimum]|uniref:kunitz trypsin inhibitor 5-like n=1 Tax=Lycium ferocissimum TaxID=112874 RepID=UPI0028153D87|nr:kunitz trypsin inhibitor 5-like [Lycium ferocissimum]
MNGHLVLHTVQEKKKGTMSTENYLKLILLQILFSLSCLTTSQQPAAPSTTPMTPTPVQDIDGHELQIGSKYTILPTQKGSSGGGGVLALAPKNRPCPFYVLQENLESSNGLPARFMPVDNKQQVINLSTDLNIVFFAATICVQSTAWKVGGADEITGRRYVMSGGMTGRPGLETLSNWFKIERYGNGSYNNTNNNRNYKIVFCPGVCSNCKVVCGNVGVFNENGKRWLGLNDEPLVVRFKKVLN